ncbi:hypothetical protein [Rhodococcus opacus]|uniref:Uncharacterized protein n=1 Tax=Rhodococcus opacus TaxID=37919 RepID=A0AAX3YRK0_RHOOP|nr:hypothetical protein [Rhodococcus opacus]WLF51490.1 hypothetical protein Q5707_39080 [Rhodococcus opacus]
MTGSANDAKKDWYRFDARDNPIGARPELTIEMGERTEHPYHQVTLNQFLRHAQTYFGADVDENTLANTTPPQPPAKSQLDEANEWLMREDNESAGLSNEDLAVAQLRKLIEVASPNVDAAREILDSPGGRQLLREISAKQPWRQYINRRP